MPSHIRTSLTTVLLFCDCGEVLEVAKTDFPAAVSTAGWHFEARLRSAVIECVECAQSPNSHARGVGRDD